jgi:O-antigen/teichoic acid export membrane protein
MIRLQQGRVDAGVPVWQSADPMSSAVPRASPAANFSWLLAERGWRVLLGLAVSLIVTRYLGPANLGLLTYAFSLCAILGTMAGFGIEDVLARELVLQPKAARALLALGLRIKLMGAAMAFTLAIVVGWIWRPGDWHVLGLVAWVAAGFFFAPADLVDLWYQARERMKAPILARQLAMVVSAAVRLGLVAAEAPLWCFAAAAAVEAGLTALGLTLLWFYGDPRPVANDTGPELRLTAGQMLREGWPLLCSGLLVVVTMHCDRLLLVRLSGETAAGIYAAAVRLTELMHVLPVALGAAILPRLALLHASDHTGYLRVARKAGVMVVAMTGVMAGACSVLAPWAIPTLLGEDYRASAEVWRVQVWTLVFIAIVSIRSRLWVVEGKTRWILAISAVTAVANVAGNLWLIPIWGALGAAWSGLIAWAASALVWPWLAPGSAAFMRRWCGLAKTAGS